MSAADINPQTETVTAKRTIRKSGSSHVVTIPPQVMQALELTQGDDVEVEADWSDGEITLRPE